MTDCPGTFTTKDLDRGNHAGIWKATCLVCDQRVPLQTDPSPKSDRLVLTQHEARKP